MLRILRLGRIDSSGSGEGESTPALTPALTPRSGSAARALARKERFSRVHCANRRGRKAGFGSTPWSRPLSWGERAGVRANHLSFSPLSTMNSCAPASHGRSTPCICSGTKPLALTKSSRPSLPPMCAMPTRTIAFFLPLRTGSSLRIQARFRSGRIFS